MGGISTHPEQEKHNNTQTPDTLSSLKKNIATPHLIQTLELTTQPQHRRPQQRSLAPPRAPIDEVVS